MAEHSSQVYSSVLNEMRKNVHIVLFKKILILLYVLKSSQLAF